MPKLKKQSSLQKLKAERIRKQKAHQQPTTSERPQSDTSASTSKHSDYNEVERFVGNSDITDDVILAAIKLMHVYAIRLKYDGYIGYYTPAELYFLSQIEHSNEHRPAIPADKDSVLIHPLKNHWITSYYQSRTQKFYIYDSLMSSEHLHETLLQLCLVYKQIDNDNVEYVHVTQQSSDPICGIMAIAFAFSCLLGQNPQKITYDIQTARSHLKDCLHYQVVLPFPTVQPPMEGLHISGSCTGHNVLPTEKMEMPHQSTTKQNDVLRQKENERAKISKRKRRAVPEFRSKENAMRNESRLKRRQEDDVKEKERQLTRHNKRKRRASPESRSIENKLRNESRSKRRQDLDIKEKDNESARKTKRKRRANPQSRSIENKIRNASRSKRREDIDIKEKEKESTRQTKRKRRASPESRSMENKLRNKSRSKRRQTTDIRNNENQQRKHNRANHHEANKQKRHRQQMKAQKRRTLESRIKVFNDLLKRGDDFVCTSCHQTFYQHSVYVVNKEYFKKKEVLPHLMDTVLTGYKSVSAQEWICKTCHGHLLNKKVPPMSLANGFQIYNLPKHLQDTSPTATEERCTALRIPFMQIKQLGMGKQYSIFGNTVNVPMNPTDVISVLPRRFEDSATVHLMFKRRLAYKSTIIHETIRPKVVYDLTKHFIENSELYKQEGLSLDETYSSHINEVNFIDENDTACEVSPNPPPPRVDHDATNSRPSGTPPDIHKTSTRTRTNIPVENNTNRTMTNDNSPSVESDKTLQCSQQSQLSDIESTNSEQSVTDSEASDSDSDDDSHKPWSEQTEEEKFSNGNKDTLLQNVDFSDDGRHALQIAPGEKNHPVSLYLDSYAEEKSFPVLFAGNKRPDDKQRRTPVKYSSICKAELRNVDRRFAQSVPNLFFKLKKLQTLQVRDAASTVLRKTNRNTLTASQIKTTNNLQNILDHDEGYTLLKTVRSSPPYYQAKQKELFAMLRQLGLPTFFATFSAAETKWTDLLQLLARKTYNREVSVEEINDMNWMERCNLIQKDPTTCARHFHYRTQLFLNNILKTPVSPIGHLEDYYIRVEYQQRGSPHLHCLFWIRGAPVFNCAPEEDIIKFIDSYISCSSDVPDEFIQFIKLQTHRHTQTCKQKGRRLCRFGFPIPPMPKTVILDPLESDMPKKDRKRAKENYLRIKTILNSLPDDEDCTFEEFLTKCDLDYEQYIIAIRSSLKRKQVFLKRHVKDRRVNAYNIGLLTIWQANTDLQYVLDPYAVCIYIASYMMKSQRGMSQLLQQAAKEAKHGNLSIRDKLRTISNKFLNHCEVSAQEAIYLLLQLPLTQSSRDVIFINTSPPDRRTRILKPMSQIENLPDSSTDITYPGLLEKYSDRPPSLEDLTLADFTAYFDKQRKTSRTTKELEDLIDVTDNNIETISPGTKIPLSNGDTLVKRSFPKVLRYVRYNVNTDKELHYRELLMLFLPWRNEASLMGDFNSYEDKVKENIDSITKVRKRYEINAEHLYERSMLQVDEELVMDNMDEIAPTTRHDEEEPNDQQILPTVLHPPNQNLSTFNEWSDGPQLNTNIVIQNRLSDLDYLNLLRGLNAEQKDFLYHILNRTKVSQEPFYLFLSGGAGVGKSHLLKAVYQSLIRYFDSLPGENPDEKKVVIAAPTGKAAFQVNGSTLHSLLHIPANHGLESCNTLDQSTLNTLRCLFAKLQVLIIDEISMVGRMMFNLIDCRLRQIFGSQQPFAGISLLLVGDLYQLQPVLDQWIFLDTNKLYGPLQTNHWQDLIQLYELKTIMRQKEDADYAQTLNRLREGLHTKSDLSLISKRMVTSQENECIHDVIHLYSSNALVDQHNNLALARITGAFSTESQAVDYTIGDVTQQVNKKIIDLAKEYPPQKTQNLQTNLPLKVSAKYMIIQNVDTDDGLTNGATCTLKYITTHQDKPQVLWVSFPDPEIGQAARHQNRHLYATNTDINRSWTPLFQVSRQFQIGKYKNVKVMRRQFPIKPAAAITIHKSQGMSLPQAIISFQGRIQRQMIYVALSRLTSLQGLHLLDFPTSKIQVDERVQKEMKRLRTDRQLSIANFPPRTDDTVLIVCHNTRSLHKHIRDLNSDHRIQTADVLIIQETWALDTDSMDEYDIPPFLPPLPVYHCTQKDHRPHCGIFIYLKPHISIASSHQYVTTGVEAIRLTITRPQQDIELVTIYCHPPGNVTKVRQAMTHLPLSTPSVILGDFNMDHLKDASIKDLQQYLHTNFNATSTGLQETTDYHSGLDHIYTSMKEYQSGVLETYWSDHKMVWLQI